MPLTFNKPLDVPRPYKSFRFDSYSLKVGRRLTLYGKLALCQFIELEADLSSFLTRSPNGWSIFGRLRVAFPRSTCCSRAESLAARRFAYREFCDWVSAERGQVKEVAIDVFESRRVRLENWLIIIEHLVCHKGQVTAALIDRFDHELLTDFTLAQAETLLSEVDAMLARAVIFQLVARGSMRCAAVDEQPLHPLSRIVRV
jgi:hypothetical protein